MTMAAPPVLTVERRTHDVAGALAALAGSVRELTSVAASPADLGPVARRELLSGFDRAVATLTALRGQVLLAERAEGTWRGHGDPTFEAWRARTSRAGARPVMVQVRQADTAAALPRVGDAVRDGSVTPDHLEALSRVVASADPQVQAALAAPEAQEELLSVARRVDAGTFGRAAARIAARLDPRGLERSYQAQRAARYLHVTDATDGTRISGLLDRMAGHRLRLALEAATPRPAKDDERTSEQRRADALGALAESVLTDPRTSSGAAVRPHVSFHMTESTWVAIRAQRRATEPTVEEPAVEPVTLDDGTPVPPSEVARALCDCELTRVVVDARGAPLDIGRAQRTYTGAQRRAVVARDRACGWAGCDAQARWCEVHHIRWWDRDKGPTSVENGVLLCSFHHHEVHRRELEISRAGPPDPEGRMRYVFMSPSGRVVSDGAVDRGS
ncbi:HNH endonuclease signature motif containing protein [Actinotalea ferrariae]|uniref:HNH endonuclease signature motif containing protein n=1 Tax=Actinotalea ferrariae TaxID=1386098 RepID=UPI0021AB0EBF|nr:HNH endonuclease signature motif containing protein [Actinotalea ferrariae]